tara:strand:- start:1393 stop:2082 length:690 start_codon:yes stop_codon:yes gene_type:complete
MKIKTALILCAGYGKRLNPLTLEQPKPLLKINEITLLDMNINLIISLGIKKILLNTFYLKEKIVNFIKKKDYGIDITIIDDGNEILDTGGGILNMINSSPDENFIVFNPDTVWSKHYLQSIKDMENFYFSKKLKNILMVVNNSLSFDKNLKGNFTLKNHKLKKQDKNDLIYIGCQILNKSLFKDIKDKNFSISDIWNDLIKENELFGFENKNNFSHVTNLDIYKELLKN